MCGFTAKNTKGKVKMELQQIIMLITIAVYLIMMVVVGVICAKKTDNVGDFYLGGRKLGDCRRTFIYRKPHKNDTSQNPKRA